MKFSCQMNILINARYIFLGKLKVLSSYNQLLEFTKFKIDIKEEISKKF